MAKTRTDNIISTILAALVLWVSATGCKTTRSLQPGQYLLRSNTIKLKSDKVITQKGELKENLNKLIIQKPNDRFLTIIPFKLWLYNYRYKKFQKDPANFQLTSKQVEPPVIYDSTLIPRSEVNLKNYLFSQGYFYSRIKDTTVFRKKKAFVTYNVNTGTNYLINNIIKDIDDKTIAEIVEQNMDETFLKKGAEFSYPLLEQEQSRIANVLRNYGYYKFTNDNVSFELDTVNKQFSVDEENAIESAINFIALQKAKKKPNLDIKLIIRDDNDSTAYYRYGISRIRVFPDFATNKDYRDSGMIQITDGGVIFKYHNYYVRTNVIRRHIFFKPETYYAQKDYDLTNSNLNSLGVFQSIRITFREDTAREGHWLNCTIILSPADKLDFNSNIEVTNGKTYTLGSGVGLSVRNKNFAKGANLLTASVNGNIESIYDSVGSNFFNRFKLNAKSVGANLSVEFPKFLLPFRQRRIQPNNAPRTAVGIGTNLLDRVKYFTMLNSSVNIAYKWKETDKKSWEISPAFINYLDMLRIDSTFQVKLTQNDYLRKTYTNTFIEGENVAFIYANGENKPGEDFSFIKLSLEEGGLILGLVNALAPIKTYSQYAKFDFDAQHFINWRHSTVALRFYGGFGLPYDKSIALPYIKQYFAGGGYSMRGWRIRSLGPGSYVTNADSGVVDRTGDIKMELNAEYRFDILKLFAGAIKMNGALFTDAGNIWLAKKPATGFTNGEFNVSRLGTDIAVDVGAGVRFDVSGFFVVRVDLAMPAKVPGYAQNGGWVFNAVDFSSSQWRKTNLIPNIAVGYPF